MVIMKISEMKILICDDSILVRKKYKEILNELNISEVFEATNGVQAVEKYMAEKPDLTFMDIVMPEKSGLDALREIRALDPDARIVVASTIGTQSNLTAAIKEGAYDFLQKPVSSEDVLRVIDSII